MNEVSDFSKRLGLAHKIIRAGELAGFTPAEWNELAEDPIRFKELHDMRVGIAVIRHLDYIINCDADPSILDGYSIEEHQKDGLRKFNPDGFELYQTKEQKKGGLSGGHEIRTLLSDKPVVNINVLDFFLERPYLVPDILKEKTNGFSKEIFFLGTIYRSTEGRFECIRSLHWHEWERDKLQQGCSSLFQSFGPTVYFLLYKGKKQF